MKPLTSPFLMVVLVQAASAQWTPPPPYDSLIRQIPDPTPDCRQTRGDIAVATIENGIPTIRHCLRRAADANALHPGAGHFYFVHEFGHHIL